MARHRNEFMTVVTVAKLLGVVVVVAALFFARDVFIPLALGLLLSFLLSPIVNRLQRMGVPNVLAVVTTATLAFVLLGVTFTLLGRELSGLITQLPQYKGELVAKARSVSGMTTGMGGGLNKLAVEVSNAMDEQVETTDKASPVLPESEQTMMQKWADKLLPADVTSDEAGNDGKTAKTAIYVKQVEKSLTLASWATTATTVLGPLATAGLVTVFALFMLIHREDLRDRVIAVISHDDYVTTTEALDEAGGRISRYLIAQTIINAGYGLVLATGLWVIGLMLTDNGTFPNAILWGALATCLRFIPYLGPTAAAIFPSAIALAVFPGYQVFMSVVLLITTLELICNNIIEPWLYGTSTGISAVAVIVAAVFWGWLWGPVGLLLSTPLTVCLVVLGRYVPGFKILATLLSDDVQIETSLRFYQRLLAADVDRAREILIEHVKEMGLDAASDEILVATLKRIRADRDSEHLTDSDADRLFALTGGLIDELKSDDQQIAETDLPLIMGANSHHFSESLLLNLLRIGGRNKFHLVGVEDDLLPQEIAGVIAKDKPCAVVVTVLPQGGFVQARFLCKTIRKEGYTCPIVVACYGKFKNFDRLFVKFRKAGATAMTTSHSQTRRKLTAIATRRDRSQPLADSNHVIVA